jgi:hypothetical protein
MHTKRWVNFIDINSRSQQGNSNYCWGRNGEVFIMAHYAIIDSNNVVVQVIVGKDEGEDGIDWEEYYGDFFNLMCKRTSYNTRGNQHTSGGTPFRKNFAGIGYTYDVDNDAFIGPKPYPSWTLNQSTYIWDAPVPKPYDGCFAWDEYNLAWEPIHE